MIFAIVVAVLLLLIGILVITMRRSGPEAVAGSGNVVSQAMQFENFTQVDVGGAFAVDISHSNLYNITITADDNLMERIQVSNERHILLIDLQPGEYQNTTLKAEITMPKLEGILLSGATRGTVTGFASADDLSVRLSGASLLEGKIEIGNGDFRLSGASRVSLAGSAHGVSISGSGASNLELSDFAVVRASIDLSGASKAALNVRGTLDVVELSGASHFSYTGDPAVKEVSTSGASTMEPR